MMNAQEREALINVVNYLWADEKKNAEETGSPDGHICRDLQVLQDYLKSGADDAMKALSRRALQAMDFGGTDQRWLEELVDIGVMEQRHDGAYTWTTKGREVRALCGLG
jgi:hypothetical protein